MRCTLGGDVEGVRKVRYANIGLGCSRKDLQVQKVQRPWGGLRSAYSGNSQEIRKAGAE